MDNINHTRLGNKLGLQCVRWNPFIILSKASLGHLMVNFGNLLVLQPKNTYQTILYKNIHPFIVKILDTFTEMLSFKTEQEKNVKLYNVLGELPHEVFINHCTDGRIYLCNLRIGKLISTTKQRVEYIINRNVPSRYIGDEILTDEFIKVRTSMKKLMLALNEFEIGFVESLNKANVYKDYD